MASCLCTIKLTDGLDYVIVDTNSCSLHKNNSGADTFKLRMWIIEEGALYNSYSDDTGDNADHGLVFKENPWHYNQFICDLNSSHALSQKDTPRLIGVNLFSDKILTIAQGKMLFRKASLLDPIKTAQRINEFIRKILALYSLTGQYEKHVEPIRNKLYDEWASAFSMDIPDESIKFENAVKQAVKEIIGNNSMSEQKEKLKLTTDVQQLIDQNRLQLDEIKMVECELKHTQRDNQLLKDQLKEYGREIQYLRKDNLSFQTEIASLKTQLQKQAACVNNVVSASQSTAPLNMVMMPQKPIVTHGNAVIQEKPCIICTFLNPIANDKCMLCNNDLKH
jgi:predicted RNA binding protein with dsRBD fold (UPF0201 family)